jgi:hypothetical protein
MFHNAFEASHSVNVYSCADSYAPLKYQFGVLFDCNTH